MYVNFRTKQSLEMNQPETVPLMMKVMQVTMTKKQTMMKSVITKKRKLLLLTKSLCPRKSYMAVTRSVSAPT